MANINRLKVVLVEQEKLVNGLLISLASLLVL